MAIEKRKIQLERVIKNVNGTTRIQLIFYTQRVSDAISEAQQFVDSEVVRLMDPYTPMLTGNLKNSTVRHTIVGSGMIKNKTPYAKRQYYAGRSPGSSQTGPLRGKMWFERMKNSHLQEILAGAKKKSREKL